MDRAGWAGRGEVGTASGGGGRTAARTRAGPASSASRRGGGRREGQLARPALGRADFLGQRVEVVDAVVPAAVDEERRRAGDTALIGAGHILADARGVLAPAQLVAEAIDIEAELACIPDQVAGGQLALVAEQEVVHVPE